MDLNRCKATPVIHAVQDDRYSRNIELSLLADGMAWLIPERVAVRIRYSKPDGKGGDYDCLPDGSCAWSAEENRLTLALAPQVLTVSGAVRLAVTMMQDQIQISTFAIVLDVSQAVHTRVCESEDYFPGYTMPAEPNADDIPKVFFGGALPQTKDDTIMSFRYISKPETSADTAKPKPRAVLPCLTPRKIRPQGCTRTLTVPKN